MAKIKLGLKAKLIDDIELSDDEADVLISQIVPDDEDNLLDSLGYNSNTKQLPMRKKSSTKRGKKKKKH